mgnify:CR=1 FL=1
MDRSVAVKRPETRDLGRTRILRPPAAVGGRETRVLTAERLAAVVAAILGCAREPCPEHSDHRRAAAAELGRALEARAAEERERAAAIADREARWARAHGGRDEATAARVGTAARIAGYIRSGALATDPVCDCPRCVSPTQHTPP